MKLKKASAWIYNNSNKDIVIDELGIKLKKKSIIDIFKLNPTLSYEKFKISRQSGVLYKKRHDLQILPGEPQRQEAISTAYEESSIPRQSLTKSIISVGKEERNWIDALEEAFPAGAQPLSQEEAWNIERQKVLQNLEKTEQGADGEVFSDVDFDSGDIEF